MRLVSVVNSGLALAAIAWSASAIAAPITWSYATVTGDVSDVTLNGGTLVSAQTYSAGNPTVNGINFTTVGAAQTVNTGWYSFGPIESGVNYSSILDTMRVAASSLALDSNHLTGASLTPGATYEIRIWAVDNRGMQDRYTTFSDGTNTISVFEDKTNTTPVTGVIGLGVNTIVIGRFIADSTASQTINISGANGAGPVADGAVVNAFTLAQVPEPASLGVLGLAGLACLRRRR